MKRHVLVTVVRLSCALVALVPLGAGCSGRPSLPAAVEPAPLRAPVVLEAGEVEVRTRAGALEKLQAGGEALEATELRSPRGGVVTIGAHPPRAKVWLREGAVVRLAEGAEGKILVEVREGEVRARSFEAASSLELRRGDEVLAAPAADVLLRAGEASPAATARDPSAADWTFGLEGARDRSPAGMGTLTFSRANDPEASLALRSVAVQADLAGDLAETRVEHVFHNDGDERLEGTFRFPVPEGAEIIGLSMEIGGSMMEGEIVEREKARRIYQEIVDEMQDPAILEWESSGAFKLRVFPIEPRSDKRIVVRYVAPLRRERGRYGYVYPVSAPDLSGSAPSFRLSFQGVTVVDAPRPPEGGEIVVPVPEASRPAEVLVEERPTGTYTAVRISSRRAHGRASSGPAAPALVRLPRALVVLVDTSRSSLTSRKLGAATLSAVLSELGPRDRFVVVAADIDQRDHAPDFVPASGSAAAEAMRFVEGIEPDGASDLGAALVHAGGLVARARAATPGAEVQVLYIGDGNPTWGVTSETALVRIAMDSLHGASLFAALLGADANAKLVGDLATAGGGFTVKPRSAAAVHRFAVQLADARAVDRLSSVRVSAPGDHEVAPLADSTLVEGDELVAVVRTPVGGKPPSSLVLTGYASGEERRIEVPVGSPVRERHVARRWAAQNIAALEREGDRKDDVVRLSLDYQVLSRSTALLVLESEEAYRQHGIERKAEAARKADDAAASPRVSGGDLESVDARTARMGVDRIQPGDPEIYVPAPADARSVVVVFPFGETKVASFDAELGQWVVRFLIDEGTPDGLYEVSVRVTHGDGRIELSSLHYTVDTVKPRVEVTVRPAPGRPGALEIRASQIIDAAEAGPALRLSRTHRERFTDARRVEVRLEDGTVLSLGSAGRGEFRAVFTPEAPAPGALKLHVVVVDRALNQSASDMVIPIELE